MARQSEAENVSKQAFSCLPRSFAPSSRLASPQIIFEMNFLPGRVNQRCADKCGGLRNARYLKTGTEVDWSWQKTGLLYEKNNKYKGFNRC